MLKLLKRLFSKQCENKVGEYLPAPTKVLSSCYAERDLVNRWQGDVYSQSNFVQSALPQGSQVSIRHWMLLNRTCHLVEEGGRTIKVGRLNFAAVLDLKDFVVHPSSTTIRNQISNIISQNEGVLFLPAFESQGVLKPLVVNFNLVITVKVEDSPTAANKVLQLSSPFCEHAFQKFSKFFYTVGFDDSEIRNKRYQDELTKDIESALGIQKS